MFVKEIVSVSFIRFVLQSYMTCFLVTQCKGDFDTVKGDCEGKKDDMVAKETATKKNVNDFLDKVLNLSTEAENLFGMLA